MHLRASLALVASLFVLPAYGQTTKQAVTIPQNTSGTLALAWSSSYSGGYPQGFIVTYNGSTYMSLTFQNTTTPGSASWQAIGGGGGSTTPATTNLYKGNGSAGGIVPATPGTDYPTVQSVTNNANAITNETNRATAAENANTALINSGGGGSYLGLVATRTEVPSFESTSSVWEMNRSVHFLRQAVSAGTLQLGWNNFYISTASATLGQELNPGPATIKAALEYPLLTTSLSAAASSGATTVTVNNASGIVAGMGFGCVNVACASSATTVASISGTTVTLSAATTASISSGAAVQFFTLTPCTFGGASTYTVAGDADAISDGCGPAMPAGATFAARSLYTNSSMIVFTSTLSANGHYATALGEGILFGTGTPTDYTAGGTWATQSTSALMSPAFIIAPTVKPSVCLVGDSRIVGLKDVVPDAQGNTGELTRIIGPAFAYMKIAASGTSGYQRLANMTNQLRDFAYCTHVIDELGVNDMVVGNKTAAATIATRTSLAAMWPGKRILGTTLPTETSSTDSWATTTNQTVLPAASNIAAFNASVRMGVPGEENEIDTAYALDPAATGLWLVSPDLFSASGTAGYGTPDGVHETAAANVLASQILGYISNWIRR